MEKLKNGDGNRTSKRKGRRKNISINDLDP